jgi:hypothetical protein
MYYVNDGFFPEGDDQMYARKLSVQDVESYDRDKAARLLKGKLREGMPAVVRLLSPSSSGQVGLEYGGFLARNDKGELCLRTVQERDKKTECFIPLYLGPDSMLYSMAVPALPERGVILPDVPRFPIARPQKQPFEFHHATPEMPAEPFGYVLSADYANEPLEGGDDLQIAS